MLPVKTIKGGSHNFNHNKLPLIGAPKFVITSLRFHMTKFVFISV